MRRRLVLCAHLAPSFAVAFRVLSLNGAAVDCEAQNGVFSPGCLVAVALLS